MNKPKICDLTNMNVSECFLMSTAEENSSLSQTHTNTDIHTQMHTANVKKKSSVVPQWPKWLWDRWRWRWTSKAIWAQNSSYRIEWCKQKILTFAEFKKQFPNGAASVGVNSSSWFVQNDGAWPAHKGNGYRQLPFHTTWWSNVQRLMSYPTSSLLTEWKHILPCLWLKAKHLSVGNGNLLSQLEFAF